ncbi:hypothetical protein [Nonomuraea sp. NPDC049400]|uniref:hypothetical protein n=1 Tax=Nonomuraea sp. NPDC049400 TaxID=3364352 RepID=UPI0037B32A6F
MAADAQSGAASGWTPVGTVDPQHVTSADTQLVLPYVRVPDGNPHTYRLRFHLDTTNATSSVDLTGTAWMYWSLKNSGGHRWVFIKCEIDEQTP